MDLILDKWMKLGFLQGLDDETSELVAHSYEEMAKFLLKNENYSVFNVILFPVVREIVSNLKRKVSPEELFDFLNNISLKEFSEKILMSNTIDDTAVLANQISNVFCQN